MTNFEKTNKFIESAKIKFPKFDYSKVDIFNNQEKDEVIIICPEHGEFKVHPRVFLRGKYGCPKCANILKGINSRKNINVVNSINIDFSDLKPVQNPIIVDKQYLIGTVYCFINKHNNKLYIGETVKCDYNYRFNEHKNKSKIKNTYFYKAICKYGWESFDKIILFQTEILENTDFNKKLLNDQVNKMEMYYINKYDTTNPEKGYNITCGGDGIVGYKHSENTKVLFSKQRSRKNHWKFGKNNVGGTPILQFDLDFNLIKEWVSMQEAARILNCNTNNISRCCNCKIDTYKGFIWVKKENYYDGYLDKYKSRAKCKSNDKSVLQYNFLGEFIAEYISCSEAGKTLNRKTVSTAASGRDPQLYGYIWIYKNEFTEQLLLEKLERVKSCKMYNKILKSIKSYENS